MDDFKNSYHDHNKTMHIRTEYRYHETYSTTQKTIKGE